jgi:hypothetical protein
VGLARTDLKVTLDGVELKAGFALGSWLAFEKMGDSGMVMGDLVLTMDEVSPVMKKLTEGGIEVTALHNHLLRNQPFMMYMHVLGPSDPVKLAAALHTALAESKTPLSTTASPAAAPPPRSSRRFRPGSAGRSQFFHLPVPQPRTDDRYFAPLARLRLRPETELYLGLVHRDDIMPGNAARLAAAQRNVRVDGVATECGTARGDPERFPALLAANAQTAELGARFNAKGELD